MIQVAPACCTPVTLSTVRGQFALSVGIDFSAR